MQRIPLLIILTTYLAISYYLIAQPARVLGFDLPGSLGTYLIAEAAAVAAAFSTLLLLQHPFRRAPAVIAVVIGMLILLAGSLNAWALGIAMMWNFSFSLYLPIPIYAVAAAIYTYTMARLWVEEGSSRAVACGLLLIAVGGLKLDSGYSALLALAGCCLIVSQMAQCRQSARADSQNFFVNIVTYDGWLRTYAGTRLCAFRALSALFARIAPDHGHRTIR